MYNHSGRDINLLCNESGCHFLVGPISCVRVVSVFCECERVESYQRRLVDVHAVVLLGDMTLPRPGVSVLGLSKYE